jgi:hypothetical protein
MAMKMWEPSTQKNGLPLVPGPSPWYLRSPAATVCTEERTWNWIEDPNLAGLCHLFSPRDEAVLTVDFYCYVQQLPGDRLLVWREWGRQKEDLSANPKIVFDLLDIRKLTSLGDAELVGKEMRAKKERIRFGGGNSHHYELASSLDEGVHSITPPAEYSRLHEVLVLGDYGPSEISSNYWDRMSRAIFAFDFQARKVEVLPQDWFNTGGYDYGYQWITRVLS